jgi:hypothetical protein
MRMQGRARDVWTPKDGGAPVLLAEDMVEIIASPRREILAISSPCNHPALPQFIGARGGGHSRALLAELLEAERAEGTPLHLLLDDFAGASLVAGWAWSRWTDDWKQAAKASGLQSTAGKNGQMEGICAGFAPGSSSLDTDGTGRQDIQSFCSVGPLVNPDDPLGWHRLEEQQGVGMRRARRLDIWQEGAETRVDLGFQDSATSPDGGRIAIHEYRVEATADADSRLSTLTVEASILPYRECHNAAPNAQRLLGRQLQHFRIAVLRELPGILGCTHLNDVLRSLADVPGLLRRGHA